MKKALIIASVASMIEQFNLPNIDILLEMGYEVHIAANFSDGNTCSDEKLVKLTKILNEKNVKIHNLEMLRNVFKFVNIKKYIELKKIINKNNYDLIHCHSPIGGVLGRLAARKSRRGGTKVVYTAHGFHFFKGAPLINWILYYTVEKWLSMYTDTLITLNSEDYIIAKRKFFCKDIIQVDGIGIDLEEFKPCSDADKQKLRKLNGYSDNQFVMVFIAELCERKNQEMLIKVTQLLKDKIPDIKLLLIGMGKQKDIYTKRVKDLNLDKCINFLGYKGNISDFLYLADIGLSSSRQEGLPVNVIECMAIGLPLVVTNCRGNRDLVKSEKNGYVVDLDDVKSMADRIFLLYSNNLKYNSIRNSNIKAVEKYGIVSISKDIKRYYHDK